MKGSAATATAPWPNRIHSFGQSHNIRPGGPGGPGPRRRGPRCPRGVVHAANAATADEAQEGPGLGGPAGAGRCATWRPLAKYSGHLPRGAAGHRHARPMHSSRLCEWSAVECLLWLWPDRDLAHPCASWRHGNGNAGNAAPGQLKCPRPQPYLGHMHGGGQSWPVLVGNKPAVARRA